MKRSLSVTLRGGCGGEVSHYNKFLELDAPDGTTFVGRECSDPVSARGIADHRNFVVAAGEEVLVVRLLVAVALSVV